MSGLLTNTIAKFTNSDRIGGLHIRIEEGLQNKLKDFTSITFSVSFRSKHAEICILALLPVIILTLYPHLPYAFSGSDAFFALGAELNIEQLKDIHSYDRRLDRLPVVIPGYFLYNVFNPIIAHKFIYFINIYGILISFFLTVKTITGVSRGAIIATGCLAINPWLLSSLGSTFLEKEVILYMTISYLMTVLAINSIKARRFLLLGGFFGGASLFSHPIAVVFFFPIPLYYLTTKYYTKKLDKDVIAEFFISYATGALLCFILFGALNVILFDRNFLFLLHQSSIGASFYAGYYREFATIYQVPSNGLIILALLLSLYAIFTIRDRHNMIRILSVCFVVSFIFYAICYGINLFYKEYPLFIIPLWLGYYKNILIPVCYVTIASVLIHNTKGITTSRMLVVFFILMFSISPNAYTIYQELDFQPSDVYLFLHVQTMTSVVLLATLLSLLCIVVLKRKTGNTLAIGILLFVNSMLFYFSSERSANGYKNIDYYERFYQANQVLFNLDIDKKDQLIFWIGDSGNPKLRTEYYALNWVWLSYKVVTDFPNLDASRSVAYDSIDYKKLLEEGARVVILNDTSDTYQQAVKELCKYNLNMDINFQGVFGKASGKFKMIVADIKHDNGACNIV